MAKKGSYTAGGGAPAQLQGQTFSSYYAYQNARSQALGYKSYAAERKAVGGMTRDPIYKTFERKATSEGRSKQWARRAYKDQANKQKSRLTREQSRQLQINTGLAESEQDTWYH